MRPRLALLSLTATLVSCGSPRVPTPTSIPTSTEARVNATAAPAPVASDTGRCALRPVEGHEHEEGERCDLRFDGTRSGCVSVIGDEEGIARDVGLVVALADGRRIEIPHHVADGFELATVSFVSCVTGADDVFVVALGDLRGEDCVRQRLVAHALREVDGRLEVIASGEIGSELNAFDACFEFGEEVFVRTDGGIEVDRVLVRDGRPEETPDEEMLRERAEAERTYRDEVAQEERHLSAELARARRSGADAARLEAIRADSEERLRMSRNMRDWAIGKPFRNCEFEGMRDTCEPREIRTRFRLGDPVPGAER